MDASLEKVEASPYKRIEICLAAIGVLVAAVAFGMGFVEKPYPLQPVDSADVAMLGDVEALRLPMRHLVVEMQAGRLLGAQAASYSESLQTANRIRRLKKTTIYIFDVDPAHIHEGSRLLYVTVQNKFDRIFRCGGSIEMCGCEGSQTTAAKPEPVPYGQDELPVIQ